MSDVDYSAIEIPEDVPPENYHWTARRAEILKLIEKKGHPDAISPTRLAGRYGVSKGQISQDKAALGDYIVRSIDESTVDSVASTVFQTAVKELMENKEYRKAVQTVSDWNEWLASRGYVEQEPDRLEANVGFQEAFMNDLRDYHKDRNG